MSKPLIIVESPAKIQTLKKFLGAKFSFASSVGHIRDLPQKDFGIDVEHGFEPKYVTLPDKVEVVKKLKEAAKKASVVYLSPDPDREGEAIAWHIASILPKNIPLKRVTFNSITKSTVLEALQHPREIDLALVNAQQARRLLDRIVGYKISPILMRKMHRRKGASAGRVQSVALKLVVEREKEIEAFIPTEYWNIKSLFTEGFEGLLFSIQDKKIDKDPGEKEAFFIPSEKDAKKIVEKLNKASYTIKTIERKEKKRHPVPPFITSTLQQEASRHFGFAVSRTMSIAQTLYEGVNLKEEGREGLITYMRTDSPQIAKEALSSVRNHIEKTFGKEYLPEKPNFYMSKKTAQEAHEAIRPTNLAHSPESIQKHLSVDQFKIYQLIWKRFIASQMESATYDTVSIDILADDMILRTTGSHIIFPGFLAVYHEKTDTQEKEEDKLLPDLKEGQDLHLQEVQFSQAFTKPPPRYTEASLVKELEKSGIGRPSTYASIMSKIQSREYTTKVHQSLKPTELGTIIIAMLEENFAPIIDVGFTAAMEDDLELVAENKTDWKALLKEFWEAFLPMVEKAQKDATVPKILTNKLCPKCQKPLQKVWSKGRYFYGCSGYPDCDFTSSIEALDFKKEDYAEDFNWEQPCPKCTAPTTLRFGRFGPFLGCSNYPKCKGIINIPKKGEKEQEKPPCPALGCDGKIIMRRSRQGRAFFSCSNFPECDVIVNDLKDLDNKYDAHHPKTAYEKKGKSRQYTLSPELSSLLEEKKLTRQEVLKKLWEYIKAHKLQNPKNKRQILPDEKLSKILGPDPIDMMKIGGLLKQHLI